MSHEGIRIVDRDTARREEAAERPLPPEAVVATKVRVRKSEGTGMDIDWKDGHHSAWGFAFLRHACPCAVCNEERKASRREPGVAPPSKEAGPFVLYQAPPRPLEVTPVGKYALRFKWNDGHESGIYSWEHLRRICICADCRSAIDVPSNESTAS